MDTSETYQKMCDKAEEIQRQRPYGRAWQEGDCFLTIKIRTRVRFASRHKNDIWLPRQDQLQGMLLDIEKWQTSIQSITILCAFARFCGSANENAEGRSNIHLRQSSLEVLWLAFVMMEKYSKCWNGNDWK